MKRIPVVLVVAAALGCLVWLAPASIRAEAGAAHGERLTAEAGHAAGGHDDAHRDEHGDGHGEDHAFGEFERAVNFVILMTILYFLGGRKIPGLLRKRADDIEADLIGAEDRRRQLQAKLEEAQKREVALEARVEEIRRQGAIAGERRAADVLSKADESIDQMNKVAEKRMQSMENRMREALAGYFVSQSLGHTEKTMSDRLSDDDRDRLVDRYIQNVGEVRL